MFENILFGPVAIIQGDDYDHQMKELSDHFFYPLIYIPRKRMVIGHPLFDEIKKQIPGTTGVIISVYYPRFYI